MGELQWAQQQELQQNRTRTQQAPMSQSAILLAKAQAADGQKTLKPSVATSSLLAKAQAAAAENRPTPKIIPRPKPGAYPSLLKPKVVDEVDPAERMSSGSAAAPKLPILSPLEFLKNQLKEQQAKTQKDLFAKLAGM